MSNEKIFESPDGGKTVYERGVNEPISARRLVQDPDDWKIIRRPYEKGIIAINNLIEIHSQKYHESRGADIFQKEAHDSLIDYLHKLKAYIQKKEEDYFK